MKAVEQYIDLCNHHFDYTTVKYRSNGVKSNGEGGFKYINSYVHCVEGIDQKYSESKNKYGWKLFFGEKCMENAKKFIIANISVRFPEKKKKGDFYVQNDVNEDPLYDYNKYFTNDKPVVKRIFKGLSGVNAKKKTNWRQYALYKDVTDPTTLVWFICWRRAIYPNIDNL